MPLDEGVLSLIGKDKLVSSSELPVPADDEEVDEEDDNDSSDVELLLA